MSEPGAPSDGQSTSDQAAADEGESDELLSQVRVIEEQPLGARAASYRALHDELQRALDAERGDSTGTR